MRRGLLVIAFASLFTVACGVPERGSERYDDPVGVNTGDRPDMDHQVRLIAHPAQGCDPGGEFPCEPTPDLGTKPDLTPTPKQPGESCGAGDTCSTWCDCITHKCHDPVVDTRCGDGVLDGWETDVDCGGPDCMPCKSGLSCQGGQGNAWWHSYCLSCFCNESGLSNTCS